jgi:hypothetical protein
MKRLCLHTFLLGNAIVVSSCLFFGSCTKDIGQSPQLTNNVNTEGCDTIVYTYNADIKNIITNSCAGCHSAGSPDGTLTDHLHLQAKALNGSLIGSLRGQGYTPMPLTGRLSECDIKGIENWVQAGAPNN